MYNQTTKQPTIMTSYTNSTTTDASRIGCNMRNRSTKYVRGKAVHVAIKRERQQEKFGASKLRDRTISKAIKARQGKQWDTIQGDLTLDCDLNDVAWFEDFQSALATPSRVYIDTRTTAQEGKDHEMRKEAVHIRVNSHKMRRR